MTSRRPVRARPRPRVLEQVSFLALRENVEPQTASARYARRILNMIPMREEVGGGLMGRPGIFRMQPAEVGGATAVQGTGQFTTRAGATFTWRVKGGLFQTFNYGTSTWSTVALGGGVALSTTARVSGVVFADNLVLSDGVNRPGMWNGTAWTNLANCPVLYGPPVVFYSRLMGIKQGDRLTIVWSEVNQPAIGYDAAPYNNAWQLGQTDQERLHALRATNEALYYFRARSIGTITGQVSQEWRSTGVQDSVSQTIGCVAPWAITTYDAAFYFLDADARPQRLPFGSRVQDPELWESVEETVKQIPVAGLADTFAAALPEYECVLLACPSSGLSTSNDQLLVFDGKRGTPLARWNGFPIGVLGQHLDGAGRLTLSIGTADGVSYHLGHLGAPVYDDALAAGTQAIQHEVVGTPLGYDLRRDAYFPRLDVALRFVTSVQQISAQLRTPYGSTPAVTISGSAAGNALWDVAQWNVGTWGAPQDDAHRAIGFASPMGRWAEVTIRHQAIGEQFALMGWAIEMIPESVAPGVP